MFHKAQATATTKYEGNRLPSVWVARRHVGVLLCLLFFLELNFKNQQFPLVDFWVPSPPGSLSAHAALFTFLASFFLTIKGDSWGQDPGAGPSL